MAQLKMLATVVFLSALLWASEVRAQWGFGPPQQILPGAAQFDPTNPGSVANQGVNNGLTYIKGRYYKVPGPSGDSAATWANESSGPTGSQGKPAGPQLGQPALPDTYVGINPSGKEMWRSGSTGRVYYRQSSSGMAKPNTGSTGSSTQGQQPGQTAPGASLTGKTNIGRAVYKDPRTGRIVYR